MFLLSLLSRLPLTLLYIFSDIMFAASYYVLGYRKKVVMTNLKNSFPEKSARELRAIAREFYRNLCDYAVESLKLLTMSSEDVIRRMKFKNLELIQEAAKQGNPMFFITSHQFNWEWLISATSLHVKV